MASAAGSRGIGRPWPDAVSLTPSLAPLDRPSPGGRGRRESAIAGRRSPPASAPASPAIRAGGRRPQAVSRALVAKAFGEEVEAKENGQPIRITKLEATVKQFVNRAASGDQRAAQFVFSLLADDSDRRRRVRRPNGSARATRWSSPRSSAASRGGRNDRGATPSRTSPGGGGGASAPHVIASAASSI